MSLWNQVKAQFGNPEIQFNRKWKRCDQYIIELEKLENAITNESRDNVIDSRFAKFRADKDSLVPLRIYNMKDDKWENQIQHKLGWRRITYQVGVSATPDCYNQDKNVIRTQGIHFFNSLLAAYWFNVTRMPEDIEFTENGEIRRLFYNKSKTQNQFLSSFGFYDFKFTENCLDN